MFVCFSRKTINLQSVGAPRGKHQRPPMCRRVVIDVTYYCQVSCVMSSSLTIPVVATLAKKLTKEQMWPVKLCRRFVIYSTSISPVRWICLSLYQVWRHFAKKLIKEQMWPIFTQRCVKSTIWERCNISSTKWGELKYCWSGHVSQSVVNRRLYQLISKF